MSVTDQPKLGIRKSELTIAVIGLIGVIATAIISNWDKLFPDRGLIHTTSTYLPTNDIETEIRYFLEVSGARKAVQDMEERLYQSAKMELLVMYPDQAREIDLIIKTIREEVPSYEENIQLYLPIYKKHFAIEEVQELNRFYSTEIMQNMNKKIPLINQDVAPLEMKLMMDFQQRLSKKLQEKFAPKASQGESAD